MFDLARIAKSGLVRQIDFHESLGSTSDRALELAAADNPPLPLLVLTERQTDGRGRGANRWQSSAGALTFSLVLDTGNERVPADHRSRLAIVAGLAVCEALSHLAPRAEWHVKWPNDVFLNGRKLAGILIEIPPRRPLHAAIGIGINVNNSFDDAPSELAQIGVSLRDALQLVGRHRACSRARSARSAIAAPSKPGQVWVMTRMFTDSR